LSGRTAKVLNVACCSTDNEQVTWRDNCDRAAVRTLHAAISPTL
jgi:hypothetical protein